MQTILMNQAIPSGHGGLIEEMMVVLRTTRGEEIRLTHKPFAKPPLTPSAEAVLQVSLNWATAGSTSDTREMIDTQMEAERQRQRERDLTTVAEIEAAFPDGEVPEKLRKVIEKVMTHG